MQMKFITIPDSQARNEAWMADELGCVIEGTCATGAFPRRTGSRRQIVTFRGRDSTCGPLSLSSWGFSPWCLQWWARLHAEFVLRTVGTACSNASSHSLLRIDAVRAKRTLVASSDSTNLNFIVRFTDGVLFFKPEIT